MALVHETSADGTRPRVQILVAAPDGEIRIPVVQLERHVADRVREIEAHRGAGGSRRRGDGAEIEQLAAQILHARPEHEREPRTLAFQRFVDVFAAQRVLARPRCHLDEMPGIEPVKLEL